MSDHSNEKANTLLPNRATVQTQGQGNRHGHTCWGHSLALLYTHSMRSYSDMKRRGANTDHSIDLLQRTGQSRSQIAGLMLNTSVSEQAAPKRQDLGGVMVLCGALT